MSQQSVLSALFQKVVPPLFPFISVISHLLPSFSLTFLFASSSLSPSLLAASLSSHLHLSLSAYVSSLPSRWWSRGPDPVVVGFQMVWLAEGSELTPRQLILSHLKPQGVREGTRTSSTMRGRGQERDRGAGGELRNSRTCHLLRLLLKQSEAVSFKVPALQSCLKHKHTHFAITQVLCNDKKKKKWLE